MDKRFTIQEDAIDPMVIYGQGCCSLCGGPLTVVDMETCFMQLSDSGSPISEDTMVKTQAVCRNCGNRIPVLRDGLKYRPDSEYSRYEMWFKQKEYERQLKLRMDSLKPTKENPFCLNLEG